jgi:nucleoside-diphosphate-sugar epimerase
MTFKNKTVLITGADGFIGSHLTEALVREGAKVKALSHYSSFNSWGWLENLPLRQFDSPKILRGQMIFHNNTCNLWHKELIKYGMFPYFIKMALFSK